MINVLMLCLLKLDYLPYLNKALMHLVVLPLQCHDLSNTNDFPHIFLSISHLHLQLVSIWLFLFVITDNETL